MTRLRYLLLHHARHSAVFRAFLAVPLWLARVRRERRARRRLCHYEDAVRGGTLLLSPLNFPGRFEVSATSDLAIRIIQDGSFEPELTNLLERFAGIDGDVINIGANVGFYAVYFAKTYGNVRRVIAIEPNPEAVDLLKANISRNETAARTAVVQMCIGAEHGEVEFAMIPGKSEYSSISNITHEAVRDVEQRHVTVRMEPLGNAMAGLETDPSLIFIDTEGAELLVLKGAEDVIRETNPVLVFECEDRLLRKFGHSSPMIDEYVSGLGYELRDASYPDHRPLHPFNGVIVAVPKRRADLIGLLQDGPAA